MMQLEEKPAVYTAKPGDYVEGVVARTTEVIASHQDEDGVHSHSIEQLQEYFRRRRNNARQTRRRSSVRVVAKKT